jgi:hypothetical protein
VRFKVVEKNKKPVSISQRRKKKERNEVIMRERGRKEKNTYRKHLYHNKLEQAYHISNLRENVTNSGFLNNLDNFLLRWKNKEKE